ncbi:unnamed protein product [Musa hybrid cultivar]
MCVVSFEVGGMPKKSKAPNHCLPQNGMNVEGENLPIELLDVFSKLMNDLVGTEQHLLKEMDFICHLATLEVSPQLRQEAWNLANDRALLFPMVNCHANFGIDEVCSVIAHLYSLSKAQYIPMYKENDSFTSRNKIQDRQTQLQKESLLDGGTKDSGTPNLGALTTDASLSKAAITKASPLDELKETMKLGDDSR